jgi:hypothetical protein
MRLDFNGITHRMPEQKAPAEMVKILPALDLPAQRAAAPTLKPKVALAILEDLRARRKKP